jgi:dTMP kinase
MIKNPYPGKLITIDGLDGSGKSIQAGLLKSFLEKNGQDVYYTHYPTEKSVYSTEIQKALKKEINLDSYQLHTLFAKDREEDFFNYVIPSLKDHFYVICDRYVFSSLAVGPKDANDLARYEELNKDFFIPDLGMIVVVKPETSLQRIIDRGEKIETYESLERLKIAYDGYMDILRRYDYLKLIDGEQDIDKIHEDIKALVKETLLK